MSAINVLFKTKLCSYYLTGSCRHQESCLHAHDEAELRPAPNFYKTKPCRLFERGRCTSEDCRRAHGEHELRRIKEFYKKKVCKYWVSQRSCARGDGCYFAHTDSHHPQEGEQIRPEAAAAAGSGSEEYGSAYSQYCDSSSSIISSSSGNRAAVVCATALGAKTTGRCRNDARRVLARINLAAAADEDTIPELRGRRTTPNEDINNMSPAFRTDGIDAACTGLKAFDNHSVAIGDAEIDKDRYRKAMNYDPVFFNPQQQQQGQDDAAAGAAAGSCPGFFGESTGSSNYRGPVDAAAAAAFWMHLTEPKEFSGPNFPPRALNEGEAARRNNIVQGRLPRSMQPPTRAGRFYLRAPPPRSPSTTSTDCGSDTSECDGAGGERPLVMMMPPPQCREMWLGGESSSCCTNVVGRSCFPTGRSESSSSSSSSSSTRRIPDALCSKIIEVGQPTGITTSDQIMTEMKRQEYNEEMPIREVQDNSLKYKQEYEKILKLLLNQGATCTTSNIKCTDEELTAAAAYLWFLVLHSIECTTDDGKTNKDYNNSCNSCNPLLSQQAGGAGVQGKLFAVEQEAAAAKIMTTTTSTSTSIIGGSF